MKNFFLTIFFSFFTVANTWAVDADSTTKTGTDEQNNQAQQFMASTAYDIKTRKVLYKEKHTLTFANGKLLRTHTKYLDNKNQLIAEMISDYSNSLMMPTYEFKDHRRQAREGLEKKGQDYFVYRQEKGKTKESKKIEKTKGVFSGQGWHYYILENMNSILKKEMNLKLLFPSKLDYYGFKLYKHAEAGTILELRLQFSNWFIRLFAPHLDLKYDTKLKKLLSYKGPSNIFDKNGDIQTVEVIYE